MAQDCKDVKHVVNWFEIPVTDIDRAVKFYTTILGIKMNVEEFEGTKMAVFPVEEGGVHGALIQRQWFLPSTQGVMIYLNANPDLSGALSKVEKAGGRIIKEKFPVGEYGFMAIFWDSEGNRVAFHSMA